MKTNHNNITAQRPPFSFLRLFAVWLVITFAGSVAVSAQDAQVALHVGKAGFIIGATGGNGTLTYKGKQCPLKVGGMSVGLTVGAASADMTGQVYNLKNLNDIDKIYSSTTASLAAGASAADMILENSKGVQLFLTGKQIGIEASLSATGLRISLQ